MAGQSWTHHNIGRLIIFAAKKLYLESGFLNLGSIALCVEATFLPATLRLIQTKVAAYLGSTDTPLEGEGNVSALNEEIDSPFYGQILTDGQNSKTLTGTLSTTVTDLCANTYSNASPIYGNSDTVQRKLCQKYVPSSLYSGKLRLYVQAVYGSTRTDYYPVPLTINPSANTFDVVINGYRLTQGMNTSGLFTDSDYNYYLIEAGYSSFTFRRLKFSSAARGWLDILATHPDRLDRPFASRVEAYALSTAVIDPDFTPVTRSTGLSISGTPYAYGFKFNWQGNQAKVVNHRSIGDGTLRASVITVDIADDMTITASQSAEGAWSNSQYFQFWYPDMFDAVTKTFGTVPASPINDAGCPMYGYYDSADVWQVFTVSTSVSNSSPAYDTGPLDQSHLTGFGLAAPNYSRIVRSGSNQVNGTVGYSFKGESGSFSVSGNVTKNSHTNPAIGANLPAYGGSTSFTGSGPLTSEGILATYLLANWPKAGRVPGWIVMASPTRHSVDWNSPRLAATIGIPVLNDIFGTAVVSVQMQNWTRINSGSERAEIMMGVPFGDCECLVWGSFTGESWLSKDFGTSSIPGVMRMSRMKVQLWNYPAGTASPTYTGTDIILDLQQLIAPNQGLNSPSLTQTGSEGAGSSTSARVSFDSSALGGWTHEITDEYLIREGILNTQTPSGWAEKFFRVDDGLGGTFNPTMIARASANGAHIFYHSEPGSPNENGYPDGANYSAIGWV